jgi:hypothetical protein
MELTAVWPPRPLIDRLRLRAASGGQDRRRVWWEGIKVVLLQSARMGGVAWHGRAWHGMGHGAWAMGTMVRQVDIGTQPRDLEIPYLENLAASHLVRGCLFVCCGGRGVAKKNVGVRSLRSCPCRASSIELKDGETAELDFASSPPMNGLHFRNETTPQDSTVHA